MQIRGMVIGALGTVVVAGSAIVGIGLANAQNGSAPTPVVTTQVPVATVAPTPVATTPAPVPTPATMPTQEPTVTTTPAAPTPVPAANIGELPPRSPVNPAIHPTATPDPSTLLPPDKDVPSGGTPVLVTE